MVVICSAASVTLGMMAVLPGYVVLTGMTGLISPSGAGVMNEVDCRVSGIMEGVVGGMVMVSVAVFAIIMLVSVDDDMGVRTGAGEGAGRCGK